MVVGHPGFFAISRQISGKQGKMPEKISGKPGKTPKKISGKLGKTPEKISGKPERLFVIY